MQDTLEFAPQQLGARAGRLSGVTSGLAAQTGQVKEMGSERRVSQSTSVLAAPRCKPSNEKRTPTATATREEENGCAIREQRPCGVGMFRAKRRECDEERASPILVGGSGPVGAVGPTVRLKIVRHGSLLARRS